jgi:guanylate kinase
MTAVFIISAPSGSGKSTLVNKVRKLIPDLEFSVSYTTRAPRGNEQHGREYFFISRPEFEEMIRRDEFLEHASVFGNYYGTARRFLQEAEQRRHDLLLDIDVQGAAQIKGKIPDAASVFILPPNRQELEQRLRDRGLDTEEVIQRRLLNASREIENYSKYDYILVNDDLAESVESLKSILLAERLKRSNPQSVADESVRMRAERCRLENVRERLKPILASFATAAVPSGNWRGLIFGKMRQWLSWAIKIKRRVFLSGA